MIFTSILFLIVAKALPSINQEISSVYFTRISAIIFIYAGVLSLNTLYIQSIGSGLGIYSGLFQITQVSVLIESFLFIIGSLILIAWPSPNKLSPNITVKVSGALSLSTASNNHNSKSEDYSLIVLFSSLGSCLLISCFDLVSLYICIELQSFGCAPSEACVDEVYLSLIIAIYLFILSDIFGLNCHKLRYPPRVIASEVVNNHSE